MSARPSTYSVLDIFADSPANSVFFFPSIMVKQVPYFFKNRNLDRHIDRHVSLHPKLGLYGNYRHFKAMANQRADKGPKTYNIKINIHIKFLKHH